LSEVFILVEYVHVRTKQVSDTKDFWFDLSNIVCEY